MEDKKTFEDAKVGDKVWDFTNEEIEESYNGDI